MTKVVDGNRQFVVKWDLDGEKRTMSLDKAQYESVGTPLQVQSETCIITAEDFEGMAGDLEQGTASDAAKTHALLVEEFDNDDADDDNTLLTTFTHYSLDMVHQRRSVWREFTFHVKLEP